LSQVYTSWQRSRPFSRTSSCSHLGAALCNFHWSKSISQSQHIRGWLGSSSRLPRWFRIAWVS